MFSAGIIAHCLAVGDSVWFAGPVAVNGASGGSQNYYKKTEDINDWSAAPVALPLARTALTGICTANRTVFMTFTGQNAVASFDSGDSWTTCDTVLPAKPVWWNGSVYVCDTKLSVDGLVWTTIPNLSGTPAFTAARKQDGLIVVAYNAGTSYFEYSFDNGGTWTAEDSIYTGEAIYSLFVGDLTDRIHYSIGSPSTINIIAYYTDDLFVNHTPSSSSSAGMYHGKYGCSRLIEKAFGDDILLSSDGGWSWRTVQTSNPGIGDFFFVDYGLNTWGLISRTASGSPNTYIVRVSIDGGVSWTTGGTLYGSVQSIAHVGRQGNCDFYPAPVYAISTGDEIFQGDPSSTSFLADVNHFGDPVFSRDGEYFATCDVAGNITMFKKLAAGGYEVIHGDFEDYLTDSGNYAFSHDGTYFVYRQDTTGTIRVFQQTAGVWTELAVPGSPTTPRHPVFHPTDSVFVCGTSGSTLNLFEISGSTVSSAYTSDSLSNFAHQYDFSPTAAEVLVGTNVGNLRVLDISDPGMGIPVVGSASATSANNGDMGLYFCADGSGIISVTDPGGAADGNIHYRSWDGATIGAATLIGTDSYRALTSSMTNDRLWLVVGGDAASPYLTVYELTADGTTISSSHNPGAAVSVSYVTWMGV